MKATTIFLTVTVLFGIVSPGHAQMQLVGKEWGDVPVPGLVGRSVHVYQDAGDPNKLIVAPFYCMKADKAGKLVVDLDEPRPDDMLNRRLTVYVLISPGNLVEAIANRIQAQEQLTTPPGPYARIIPIKLITPALQNVSVVEDSPGRPLFKPVVQAGVMEGRMIPVTAILPAAQAEALKADLQSGKQSVTFKFTAVINARKTVAEVLVNASKFRVAETDAYKKLVGKGGAFRINVGEGGVSGEAAALTAEQLGKFGADLKGDVQALIKKTGKPEMTRIDKQLDDFMKSAFSTQPIDKDFGKQLSRLYAYDLPPVALQPDQIDALVAKMQKDFESEDKDSLHIKVDAKASGFLGLVDGELNTDIKKDTLKKNMEKRGWQFDGKGKWGVPRSLNVHIVDHQKIRTEGVFIAESDEGEFQNLMANEMISTVQRYDPEQATAPDPWVELARLTKQVAVLESSGLHHSLVLEANLESFVLGKVPGKGFEIAGVVGKTKVFQLPNHVKNVVAAWPEVIDVSGPKGGVNPILLGIKKNKIELIADADSVMLAANPNLTATMRIRIHYLYTK